VAEAGAEIKPKRRADRARQLDHLLTAAIHPSAQADLEAGGALRVPPLLRFAVRKDRCREPISLR